MSKTPKPDDTTQPHTPITESVNEPGDKANATRPTPEDIAASKDAPHATDEAHPDEDEDAKVSSKSTRKRD
jgi:hypothetical protein